MPMRRVAVTGKRLRISLTVGALSRHTGTMIVAIGTDMVDIARFEGLMDTVPNLARRLLTDAEATACAGSAQSLAARFAAKEAVVKAMGSALAQAGRRAPAGWRFTEIEVEGGRGTAPRITLHGVAARAAADLGIGRWHLSLTHEAGLSQAFVVAEATDRETAPPPQAPGAEFAG